MKNKIIKITLLLLIISFSWLGLLNISKTLADSPDTIYVPDDYSTIQAAVDAANSGDTIIVRDGTYTENIDVNKVHLTIKSENGAEKTIVQAANSNDVFRITADYVNINGFTIRNSSYFSGVTLFRANNSLIANNIVSNNQNGIYLYASNYNTIKENRTLNNYSGIWLHASSNDNIVTHNITNSNERFGIWLNEANNNIVTNNQVLDNHRDPYSLVGWGGISIGFSNGNIVTNNNIEFNEAGIYLYESATNNKIYLNNFLNNADDIESYGSTNIWNSPEQIAYAYNNKTYTNHLGNYWDYYTDVDINNDGIWDNSYVIDENNQDSYPLMQPFENYVEGETPPENQPPTCKIELRKNGEKIDEIDVGEFFDIYVSTTGNVEKIKFANDDTQNGKLDSGIGWTDPPFNWNQNGKWWEWNWDASNKVMQWSFSTSGNKEIWVEVKDNNNILNTCSVNISSTIKNPPVLLVHGFQLETIIDFYPAEEWKEMIHNLTGKSIGYIEENKEQDGDRFVRFPGNGFVVYASNYAHAHSGFGGGGTFSDIRNYAKGLAFEIEMIKENEDVDKIDIVAHSMGGLVARSYIEVDDLKLLQDDYDYNYSDYYGNDKELNYNNDVGKLIMLGTPNHGAKFAEIFSILSCPSISAMEPESEFLNILNYGCADCMCGNCLTENDLVNSLVKYTTIAGDVHKCGTFLNPVASILCSINRQISHDGVVNIKSAKLNVKLNDVPHYVFSVDHTKLRTSNSTNSANNLVKNLLNRDEEQINIISYSPKNPQSGDIVTFEVQSYKDNAIYKWNFGDGKNSEGPVVFHRFRGEMGNPKNYTVKLTMIENNNVSDFVTSITIRPLQKTIKVSGSRVIPVLDSFVKMTVLYNWIGINDNGENYYVISNITSESQGLAGIYWTMIVDTDWIIPAIVWGDIARIVVIDYKKSYDYPFDVTPLIGFPVSESRLVSLVFQKGTDYEELFKGIKVKYTDSMITWGAADVISTAFFPDSSAVGSNSKLKWLLDKLTGSLKSPCELRFYDSQNRITGLVNGEIKEEIPNSIYDTENKTVTIFFPDDDYRYEVVGTEDPDEDTYGLEITSVENGEATTFSATDVPTTPGQIHQYTIDWQALAQDEKGVTVQIDKDGDGDFEETFKTGSDFNMALETQIAIIEMIYGGTNILNNVTQDVGDSVAPLLLAELKQSTVDLEDYTPDGKLNPGQKKKLKMKFKFLETAGNEYQGKSINVNFNFLAKQ